MFRLSPKLARDPSENVRFESRRGAKSSLADDCTRWMFELVGKKASDYLIASDTFSPCSYFPKH